MYNKGMLEEDTQEVGPHKSDFKEALQKMSVEEVPPELANSAVRALDTKLVNEGGHALASIDRKKLNTNSARFASFDWGGVLVVPEQEGGPELAILYDGAQGEIAGYGAFGIDSTGLGEVGIFAGRIFNRSNEAFKQRGIKPRDVMRDRMWVHVALASQDINTLKVNQDQLYRPEITGAERTALPAYWMMGFRSGKEDEHDILRRLSMHERVGENELIQLAQESPLYMDLKPYSIQAAKAENEIRKVNASAKTETLLNQANGKALSEVTGKVSREKLQNIAARVREL
jgi:hypothetical protein